jgi:hypothetical protein
MTESNGKFFWLFIVTFFGYTGTWNRNRMKIMRHRKTSYRYFFLVHVGVSSQAQDICIEVQVKKTI